MLILEQVLKSVWFYFKPQIGESLFVSETSVFGAVWSSSSDDFGYRFPKSPREFRDSTRR